MTVQMVVKALEAEGRLTAAQRLVLYQLAFRADRKGIVRASQADIAALTGLSRQTAASAYLELKAADIIEKENGSSRYRFIDGAIDHLDELLA